MFGLTRHMPCITLRKKKLYFGKIHVFRGSKICS